MNAYRLRLLSASALALGIGFAAAPASAFDKVNWEWNLKVNETVTKNININRTFDPTGVVLLEDIQVQVGNISANSTIDGINNNQPTGGGSGKVSFTVSFDDQYVGQPPTGGIDPHTYSGTATLGGGLSGTGTIAGQVLEGNDRVNGTATFSNITVTVPPSPSFDARTELPTVVSAATAVGNNVTVESDVMVEMHNGQFVFNVAPNASTGIPTPGQAIGAQTIVDLFEGNYGDINTNHLVGAAVLIGAATGLFTPANITATSSVKNILNAAVDSAATAVGNNKSITINPHTRGDAVLIGDMTQVSVANLSASSTVQNVNLNNYTHLGELTQLDGGTGKRPIVSSVATAVGNNLSIKVAAPSAFPKP